MSRKPKTTRAAAAYITPAKAQAAFGVGAESLRTWASKGLLQHIRTPGGKFLYSSTGLSTLLHHAPEGASQPAEERLFFAYARVSSAKQSDAGDLERQKAALADACPSHRLVSDVGSGLNWRRPGFVRILDKVLDGRVAEVVVARRDRLCRFGVELLERVFSHFETKLVVLGSDVAPTDAAGGHDPAAELAEDLLAITTVFVAHANGLRSATNKAAAAAAGRGIKRGRSDRAGPREPPAKRRRDSQSPDR